MDSVNSSCKGLINGLSWNRVLPHSCQEVTIRNGISFRGNVPFHNEPITKIDDPLSLVNLKKGITFDQNNFPNCHLLTGMRQRSFRR